MSFCILLLLYLLCFLISSFFVCTSYPTALSSFPFCSHDSFSTGPAIPQHPSHSLLHFLHTYCIIVLVTQWCCHNPSWWASYGVRRSVNIPQGEKERGDLGWEKEWQERWQHFSFRWLWSAIKVLYEIYHPLLLNTGRPPAAAYMHAWTGVFCVNIIGLVYTYPYRSANYC